MLLYFRFPLNRKEKQVLRDGSHDITGRYSINTITIFPKLFDLSAYSQLKADLDKEAKAEAEREMRRLKEQEEQQRRQLEDRRLRELAAIQQADVSDAERQKMLQEHERNMARLQEELRQEQERGRAALLMKLEAQRQKREATEKAKLAKAALLNEEENNRSRMMDRLTETPREQTGTGQLRDFSHRLILNRSDRN